jgi:hypothetical protein
VDLFTSSAEVTNISNLIKVKKNAAAQLAERPLTPYGVNGTQFPGFYIEYTDYNKQYNHSNFN